MASMFDILKLLEIQRMNRHAFKRQSSTVSKVGVFQSAELGYFNRWRQRIAEVIGSGAATVHNVQTQTRRAGLRWPQCNECFLSMM